MDGGENREGEKNGKQRLFDKDILDKVDRYAFEEMITRWLENILDEVVRD